MLLTCSCHHNQHGRPIAARFIKRMNASVSEQGTWTSPAALSRKWLKTVSPIVCMYLKVFIYDVRSTGFCATVDTNHVLKSSDC